MNDQPIVYRPHDRYVLYAGASLIMVAAFVWLLWRQYEAGALFFLIVAVGSSIWSVGNLLSRVEVEATGLIVRVPLWPARRIDWRQLSAVTEDGRFLRALVILYYPLRTDGLVDVDDLRSQILPAVENQSELLEFLQEKTPRP
jgi:hypothetical protein